MRKLIPTDKMFDVYKSIITKQTFIYSVNNNVYILGDKVFKECTEDEREIYNDFQNEMMNISKLPYKSNLEKKDLTQFNVIWGKIKIILHPYILNGDQIDNCELCKLLKKCNDDSLDSINKQLEIRYQALEYYNNFFEE